MRKSVKLGDKDVNEYVKKTYLKNFNTLLFGPSTFIPHLYEIFEVTEPLELTSGIWVTAVPILEIGIYRLTNCLGCEVYHVEKYEHGCWNRFGGIFVIDEENEVQIDWRGTRPAIVQYEIPL
ncbi:MAG: hypothetical protein ACD_14C00018G0001 [uncultured bacterium]|nr:MAG: hypothetical protein ACD_14C00018G0001 [uncultured bacterium]KKQ45198.1 MAG: hypothetical protein US63_C0020G0022 [Candidatus Moranbacteria bacterium GW2011_GWC2_37_8]KKQ60964.1 MAG: hypothetical protein US82_C0026G0023 [Parcubacteria group bacterium GW2011_GWC1_38_22]